MKRTKLKEVLKIKRGTSLSGDYYSDQGKKIRLTLGNFNYPNGGFKNNTSKSNIYFNGFVKPEFILKKGDIITPLTEQVYGLLGETARIPEDNLYIQSGDVGLVIPNELFLDRNFAFYLLSSPMVKKQIGAAAQQTKIRHTSPEKIMDCIVYLPEINHQKKAGKLLDLITRKIENNISLVDELEAIAEIIFNYWFLQFNFPDASGRPYSSGGGKMVSNEELKINIPLNWRVESLYDSTLCKIIQPGVQYFDSKNYLATANVDESLIKDGDWIKFEERETRANMQPVQYSVWFAKMKNSVKHISIPKNSQWFTDKYILSTGFFGLLCDSNSYSYIHSFIKSQNFETRKNILAHGATQEAVNIEDLKGIKIVVPSETLLKKYSKVVNPILDLMFSKMRENKELEELRNFLIPILINGQLKFKEN